MICAVELNTVVTIISSGTWTQKTLVEDKNKRH